MKFTHLREVFGLYLLGEQREPSNVSAANIAGYSNMLGNAQALPMC